MIKVIHLLSGDLWAGAEVMAITLLENLRAQGRIDLKVVLLNEGPVADRLISGKMDVVVLDENDHGFFKLVSALNGILKTFSPHVIHSHGYKENILSFLSSRGLPKTNLMNTMHGMPEFHGPGISIRHRLALKMNFFLLRRGFRLITAVSEEMRHRLTAMYGMPVEKVMVVHNGIEIPESTASKRKTRFVIGSSGRLFPVKNYRLFVEMAAIIARTEKNIFFELAGNGPESNRLKKLCSQKGLDRFFTFKGHVKDMGPFYNGLDLYVNTSIHEGIPLGVLEAMGHGLPVIAPNVGGLKEIVDNGFDGYLISRHDPSIFSEKCIDLYENEIKREKMSNAAVKKVRNRFSAERMAFEYFQLYHRLHAPS